MRSSRLLLVTSFSLVACTSGFADSSAHGTDAAPPLVSDAAHVGDAGSPAICASAIDLDSAGTVLTSGVGRAFAGSNTSAPLAPSLDLALPNCTVGIDREVAFTYTMTTRARLLASTVDPTTVEAFDTVVWIVDACGAGASELGCSDDFGASSTQSAAITDVLEPGTQLVVVVAGFAAGHADQGDFRLTVREVQPHGAGETCSDGNYFCVDGYACAQPPGAMQPTCVAGGDEGTVCSDTSPCGSGLVCPTYGPRQGMCTTPHAIGDPCTAESYVCAIGSHCEDDPGAIGMGHCLRDGTANAQCRLSGMPCDDALQCTFTPPTIGDVCQPPIAAGDACDDAHYACVTGATCVVPSASSTMGTCVVDGTLGGACRLSGAPCDDGLGCTATPPQRWVRGVCMTPLATGAACSADEPVCVAGDSCVHDTDSFSPLHCRVDGSANAACRPSAPRCDGALGCDTTLGLCR